MIMANLNIFDIAGSGMNAQSVRLNLVASNIANANSVSSSLDTVYKSRQPVFATELKNRLNQQDLGSNVKVLGVVESQEPAVMEYAPNHPMADQAGYIYKPNVNTIEEMANMMSASRSYQNNVEVLNTAKELILQTLRMGK
jgi:flagellar basal-body rod protein FlgC